MGQAILMPVYMCWLREIYNSSESVYNEAGRMCASRLRRVSRNQLKSNQMKIFEIIASSMFDAAVKIIVVGILWPSIVALSTV